MAAKYRITVDYGRDSSGKRLRKNITANTRAELKRKEAEFRASLALGDILVTENTTFDKYAQAWLTTSKDIRSAATKAMYENCLTKHLSALDGIAMNKIKPTMLQLIINERKDHPRTCQIIRTTLQQIFRAAIRDDIIKKDPTEGLEIPQFKAEEKRPLTEFEKKRIFNLELRDRDKLFLYIGYGCGLRREEILALSRNDIDFRQGVIHVNKAVAIVNNLPILKETKSAAGVRDVPMPAFLAKFCRQYLKEHEELLLFPNEKGNYYGSATYNRMWARIIAELYKDLTPKQQRQEPQDLTAHILRHNYCTELCYAGISVKEVARLMGHSNYKMIMEVYSHIDGQKEATKDKIAAINF